MVGRGAQGRPWFPGQLARYLGTGETRSAIRRSASSSHSITALYEEMLTHHGARIGVRHARKHLGWALDAAAETAGVAAEQAEGRARARADLRGSRRSPQRRLDGTPTRSFGWRAAA